MMHLTVVHFILIFIFLMVFILLTILSMKEDNTKNRVMLILSSFVISAIGAVVSLFLLDHYTKKAKLLSYTTTRLYNKEQVSIRGSIKNVGKYHISYCTLDIRIINKVKHKKNKKRLYYKTSSISDMFKGSKYKKNFIKTSIRAVENIRPKLTKPFKVNIDMPSEFQNPKYFFHLVCH